LHGYRFYVPSEREAVSWHPFFKATHVISRSSFTRTCGLAGRRLQASAGCQSCCGKEADCGLAWKGQSPGMCCSQGANVDPSQMYCCPTANGCAPNFQCPMARMAPQTGPPIVHNTGSRYATPGAHSGAALIGLLMPLLLLLGLCCCLSQLCGKQHGYHHGGSMMGGGYPMGGGMGGGYPMMGGGYPMMGMGGGYPMGGMGGYGGGYGAGTVGAAGLGGLLGGMFLGEQMAGGGFGGGGYGGGEMMDYGGGGGGFMPADGGFGGDGGMMAADGGQY